MEKFGFVYIWRDAKHDRYYVGRHWGTEDDGYISSSPRLSTARSRRPNDFKRRIVSRVYDRDELVLEEQRWLDMIKPEECGSRYYNRSLSATTPTMRGRKHTEETKRKMSEAQRGKTRTEEHKEKVRQANLGKKYSDETNAKKGKQFTDERKKQISETMKEHFKNNPRSIETRRKISENSKRLQREGKIGMSGKQHSNETKIKMTESHAKHYNIRFPCGKEVTIFNLSQFCQQHQLHNGHMSAVAKGKAKQHKGFICSYKYT